MVLTGFAPPQQIVLFAFLILNWQEKHWKHGSCWKIIHGVVGPVCERGGWGWGERECVYLRNKPQPSLPMFHECSWLSGMYLWSGTVSLAYLNKEMGVGVEISGFCIGRNVAYCAKVRVTSFYPPTFASDHAHHSQPAAPESLAIREHGHWAKKGSAPWI